MVRRRHKYPHLPARCKDRRKQTTVQSSQSSTRPQKNKNNNKIIIIINAKVTIIFIIKRLQTDILINIFIGIMYSDNIINKLFHFFLLAV